MSPSPAPSEPTRRASAWPEEWRGLVDDAAIFPPGDAPLHEATAAHTARREEWWADLVGSFVLRDTDLPLVRGFGGPLSVVVTGGAGQLAGPLGAAGRLGLHVAAVEIAVRDVDDPVGNVRRIDAALRAAGADDVPLYVELPGPVTPTWLAAADEVAACGHRLKLRLGHVDHDLVPGSATVAGWVDAALDRETPFKATAGLHRAVRHEPQGGGAHGFLNLLAATRALWDGGTVDDATAALEVRDGAALTAALAGGGVASARRWFTSFGSCSVTEPLDDLIALVLVEDNA
ncbi:hypothetical protein [Nocardioides sp. zg-1228]|uniref:hypothetical protein n=1 Tax=Nocardioides sp. zg-1228 TaxID=2763008 RepID=UPI0016423762|nr:hypothetical protein [Nocardioides sp. zg-1228]MBC2932721.1 hypothetical protein [Nocardioides sp. zg-1228]QSF58198.1 hypothetical protein JX575_03015 [Nocardioides sp. zg-1228]